VIAAVLAAGRVVATSALRRRVADADVVIAADGGARHARPLGVRLDAIVGDLDSIDGATLRRHADAEVQRHDVDKDRLDLELALDDAEARGATTLLVVGVFGGRLDHELAAVAIAQARHRAGREVEVHSGDALALPVRAGQTRPLDLPGGVTISVFAAEPGTRVSLAGTRYHLVDADLEPWSGLAVSNVTTEDPTSVRVHAGSALVVVPVLPGVDPADVVWGRHAERIDDGLRRLDPVLGDLVRRVAYDEVFALPGLDLRTRELLALAHLLSLGAEGELRTHLHGALRAGATPDELRAMLAHAAMFIGFPRALIGAKALRDVLEPEGP
jgi:thiamine pyrophosphokinase